MGKHHPVQLLLVAAAAVAAASFCSKDSCRMTPSSPAAAGCCCCCCCCSFCSKDSCRMGKHHGSGGGSNPKQGSKVLFPGLLPLASAGVGGFPSALPLASAGAAASTKTASKKSAPGGKHHASEGRASAKTTPKNCLTCRLKS